MCATSLLDRVQEVLEVLALGHASTLGGAGDHCQLRMRKAPRMSERGVLQGVQDSNLQLSVLETDALSD